MTLNYVYEQTLKEPINLAPRPRPQPLSFKHPHRFPYALEKNSYVRGP